MEKVAVIGAVRTPIGRYIGGLREVPAYDLGALVLKEVAKRAKIEPAWVDDVIMGMCYSSGEYVNIARMSILNAGWPESVPGITFDRRCCSGLDAICFGGMKIQTGNANIVISGGVESMSTAEFYLPGNIKWGIGGKNDPGVAYSTGVGGKNFPVGFMPRGHGAMAMWGMPFYDRIARGRLMSQPVWRYGVLDSMMVWGDGAAREENIPREKVDAWAAGAHRKAIAAIDSGKFKEEIVPVSIPQGKGQPIVFDTDETPRRDTTIEQLAKLPSVLGGVSTAGNSSSENDGAAAIVLISEAKAMELKATPMAYLKSFAVAGADPTRTWLAVPEAVNRALKLAGLTIKQIDLLEIQEAFGGQLMADVKELGLSDAEAEQKVNVNGSGISLGHPVGATGAMRLTTLLHEMKRRNAKYGLETICGGGGLGICAIFERP